MEHNKQAVEHIDHPAHYNSNEATCDHCGKPIECIEVVRHFNFNLGNVIKYLWRCAYKGDSLKDLKKAMWYLDDEIKEREKAIAKKEKRRGLGFHWNNNIP